MSSATFKAVKVDNRMVWAGLVLAGGVVVYLLWDKITALFNAVIDDTGGIFSGNNALTAGTDYSGTGILGTAGAAVNSTLGGAPESIGDAIGSGLYDLLNGGSYTGYSYSTTLHRWTQVQDNSGAIFNVDASGNITGPAS